MKEGIDRLAQQVSTIMDIQRPFSQDMHVYNELKFGRSAILEAITSKRPNSLSSKSSYRVSFGVKRQETFCRILIHPSRREHHLLSLDMQCLLNK